MTRNRGGPLQSLIIQGYIIDFSASRALAGEAVDSLIEVAKHVVTPCVVELAMGLRSPHVSMRVVQVAPVGDGQESRQVVGRGC